MNKERLLIKYKLSNFVRFAFAKVNPGVLYHHNWHIDCISEHLEHVWSGDIKRLIINIMPRSLKSIVSSVAFPAWGLGQDPSVKFLCASYGDKLAMQLSQNTRLIMESQGYKELFPETAIAEGDDRQRDFYTSMRGGRFATSVGGVVTGIGGNILIADDLHKTEDAAYETPRLEAINWFRQTFMSRLNDRKHDSIVLIGQRIHPEDVSGALLESGTWHHLVLPAYAEDRRIISIGDKTWEMEEGEYLQPSRLGKEEVEQLQADMSPMDFMAQYQQVPIVNEGNEIKAQKWNILPVVPPDNDIAKMNLYIMVDPANSKKKNSDYTAMVVVGLGCDKNYYILDIVRERYNPSERIEALFDLYTKWASITKSTVRVGYEKNSLAADIHFIKKYQNDINYRFPITELSSTMPKVDRIRRLVNPTEMGQIYIPARILGKENANINLTEELIKEAKMFPMGTHDDMIDALSRIFDPQITLVFPKLKKPAKVMVGYEPKPQKGRSWVNY